MKTASWVFFFIGAFLLLVIVIALAVLLIPIVVLCVPMAAMFQISAWIHNPIFEAMNDGYEDAKRKASTVKEEGVGNC